MADQGKNIMTLIENNPLLLAILTGVVATFVGGIALFYLFKCIKKRRTKTELKARINNADKFLEKDMIDESLAIYHDVLKTVAARDYPEIYGHVKYQEGICYYELSWVSDKEKNLTKAIRSYEEALEIYSLNKYPTEYAGVHNDLGSTYRMLAEVREQEKNLTKAIRSYEKALEIYTMGKYPLDYAKTNMNLGDAYYSLSEVRNSEVNLCAAIRTYEKALKIYTVEKYPIYYETIMSKMRKAKQKMKNRH